MIIPEPPHNLTIPVPFLIFHVCQLLFNGIKRLLILGQTVEQSGISFRKLTCMRDIAIGCCIREWTRLILCDI